MMMIIDYIRWGKFFHKRTDEQGNSRSRISSGRFDTSGSKKALLVPEIEGGPVSVAEKQKEKEQKLGVF